MIAALLLAAIAPIAGQAQQFKIATLAPDGSSWMERMREAADEVRARTDGAVRIRFYPGGVMGDADTLMRRIRLGQLHGGTFTLFELSSIAPEANLYSLPFEFRNAQELAQLREEFDPVILAALREGGMVAPAIANGGFAYLFSELRIAGTDDVSSALKVWVQEDDPMSLRVLKEVGASPVVMSIAEVYTGLQTGAINTFASTLSGAIILQWHTRAQYMLDLPVLVTAGTIALDRKAFERLDPAHREIWLEVFGEALRAQQRQAKAENAEARQALIEEGIEIVDPDPADVRAWERISDRVVDEMTASGEFPVPGLQRLRARLRETRAEDEGAGR
ncbi:MAG: TRAP transporter substrate-binding protein DctP [Wenzhouxiangellaceae bacterium]|nr:TRAP transporter substrate-binding protein DctP [Wenzhouxiangellaceae bacterium]